MPRLIIEQVSAADAGFKELSQKAAERLVAMPGRPMPGRVHPLPHPLVPI